MSNDIPEAQYTPCNLLQLMLKEAQLASVDNTPVFSGFSLELTHRFSLYGEDLRLAILKVTRPHDEWGGDLYKDKYLLKLVHVRDLSPIQDLDIYTMPPENIVSLCAAMQRSGHSEAYVETILGHIYIRRYRGFVP